MPICARHTLVDLTPKYPTFVATTPRRVGPLRARVKSAKVRPTPYVYGTSPGWPLNILETSVARYQNGLQQQLCTVTCTTVKV